MTNRAKERALTLDVGDDGIAIVTLDVPGESQNTLKDEFRDEFAEIQTRIEQSDAVRAVVIRSGKPDSFLAGADIAMLESAKTAREAADLSRGGQRAFDRLAESPVPVVAAIHGPCLGGGLELALACTSRICSDDRTTALGLPECQLGLLPGAGGTQRLPRQVGVAAALDMMLTGRKIRAKRARKMGLVDEVVPASILLDVAIRRAASLADRPESKATALTRVGRSFMKLGTSKGATELALEDNPLGRKILFQQARKKIAAQTRGNYPAHERIIDAVEIGLDEGMRAGLDAEALFFGDLVVSPQARALIAMYFGMTALKKESGARNKRTRPRPVSTVGVLGAGLMGAGVAYVTVDRADIDVRMKDQDDEGLSRGLAAVHKILSKSVSRKRMSRLDADRQLRRISTTTGYGGFERCDVVIEAVPEILELKHRVLRDIERRCEDDVIFASNTSSIPIARIAEASGHPETVIGMHYFSPVEKMPLLEIIRTKQTSDKVVATCVALGKKQGKTVIVVNDGVGFYTSRILAPYMNEAAYLLAEGVPIDRIDEALMDWGYPVGPITLLDEVGIDVAAKVGPIMVDEFGARMEPPGATDLLVGDDRLGRKNKRGFYRYGGREGGPKKVDESVYALLDVSPNNLMDPTTIAERCGLQMINEAAFCLQEGILTSPRDGDIGAIFGLGFPPFRGGPFRYVDHVGAAAIVNRLQQFRDSHGIRFEPAEILVERARSGRRFHD